MGFTKFYPLSWCHGFRCGFRKWNHRKGSGDTVYLRGTNAGGWLVQESWMNPTNAKDQKTMMNTFKTRFTESVRDQLIDVYEYSYWTLIP